MENELLDSRMNSGELGVLYKINSTKAFNNVSWKFLIVCWGDLDLETNGWLG